VKQQKIIGMQRTRRCFRVANHVKRVTTRPRLAVFRSVKHMYAQIIDDGVGKTLVSASTVDKALREQLKGTGNKTAAAVVGKALAERALEAGIKQVAFDRRQCRYHGRVAALADAARKAGLEF
jgi:large subunit ribosomal protein L18